MKNITLIYTLLLVVLLSLNTVSAEWKTNPYLQNIIDSCFSFDKDELIPLDYYEPSANISLFINTTYADSRYVWRSDWTTHDNYPANCGAGNYVYGLGDTLSCSAPPTGGNTTEQIRNAINNSGSYNITSWFTNYMSNITERNLFTTTFNNTYHAYGSQIASIKIKTMFGGSSSAVLSSSAVCDPNGNVCSTIDLNAKTGLKVAYSGIAKNLYATVTIAPTGFNYCQFYVRISTNCVNAYTNTPLFCTITAGQTSCSNITSMQGFSAGQCMQILFTENSTCSGFLNWGLEYDEIEPE